MDKVLKEIGKTGIDLAVVEVGDYLEFSYNGKPRTVVVVAPDYKNLLHVYEVTEADRQKILAEVMESKPAKLDEGQLWYMHGESTWAYKTFKRDQLGPLQRVEFAWEATNKQKQSVNAPTEATATTADGGCGDASGPSPCA